jgi:hypothetical protein
MILNRRTQVMDVQAEVESFLQQFNEQRERNGLIYYNDRKNLQGLLKLELTARQRAQAIKGLKAEDHFGGPQTDEQEPSRVYWEFRKTIRNKRISIQLSLGEPSGPACCHAFELSY